MNILKLHGVLPSWKLIYPPKKALLKMIFLFPRWDMFPCKGNVLLLLLLLLWLWLLLLLLWLWWLWLLLLLLLLLFFCCCLGAKCCWKLTTLTAPPERSTTGTSGRSSSRSTRGRSAMGRGKCHFCGRASCFSKRRSGNSCLDPGELCRKKWVLWLVWMLYPNMFIFFNMFHFICVYTYHIYI